VSVPLHFSQCKPGTDGAAIVRAFERHYEGERFIRVMPAGDPSLAEPNFFDVQGSNDTNRIDLFVFADAEQCILIAREDNLGKGASGAAVQCMNLHLGCDEGLGL
jgi:N-acetyl-gamma-glutamyl-phosphate reductase